MEQDIYRILADTVFWFHMAWAMLLLGGIFASLKWDWYGPYHGVVLLSTVVGQLLFQGCPLFQLEMVLRKQYDPTVTTNVSFICHYLEKGFGIQVVPGFITLVLVGIVALFIAVFLRRPKER